LLYCSYYVSKYPIVLKGAIKGEAKGAEAPLLAKLKLRKK